jgi:hypothetical protein
MRRIAVFLTLAVLLAVSLSAGYLASEWPDYCRRLGWCAASGLTGSKHLIYK